MREFLDELKESNPDDFAAVIAGLAKLRNRHYHRPPLSKPIGNFLFELRHVGKLNTRVLYFFVKGRRILIVHGIRNKAIKFLREIVELPWKDNVIGWRGTRYETMDQF